jgi:diadenosine tetraphosphate (Ap4A) HIT family hydrolase
MLGRDFIGGKYMFTLDPRLEKDTIELDKWPLSRVLLMNDTQYPWLILVPQVPEIREIIDLDADERATLMDEIVRASSVLKKMVNPHKLNVAALGNAVPQLHCHVIARFTTDPAWPKPIWGVKPAVAYTEDKIADFRRRFAFAAG